MKTLFTLLFFCSCFSQARAQLLDFDFSFARVNGGPPPVTGEIFGLEPNAASTPESITITSEPIGFQIPLPLTFTMLSGTITVSGHQITSVNNVTEFTPGGYFFALNGTGGGDNALIDYNAVEQYINYGGFAGVTYSFAGVESTPEPKTLLLGVLAFTFFGVVRHLPFWCQRLARISATD